MAIREVIFRGKRLDNGEWVQGDLLQWANETQIAVKYCDNYARRFEYVDPKTVGQYTGLTDKNGTKIFEGDIVKDDWGKAYEVLYTTTSCSFVLKDHNPPNKWEKGKYQIGEGWCTKMQVIGNIHDNPELIGGADNG